MNEKKKYYLSISDIINESIIRDLILFTFIFLLVIAQGWENILLLLFPLITFTFSLFFRIISSNKKRTEFKNSSIIYNPFGLEKKNANRLFFSSLFQLILIFWLGAESLYNPHLVEGYFFYFIGFFIFSYTFGFFWIFLDLWKYTKIEIITTVIDDKLPQQNEFEFSRDLNNVIAFLKIKYFRLISIINFLVFIILNMINVVSLLLINFDSSLGLELSLPGSGNADSEPLIIPYFFYGFLVISPLLIAMIFVLNYNEINHFNQEKLNEIIEPLPRNLQIKIIENLKVLKNKMKEQLSIE